VTSRVDFVLADLLTATAPAAVDVLVFNPPYVPSEADEIGLDCDWAPDISAAWAGGVRGREVIDRLVPMVWGRLRPGGSFYRPGPPGVFKRP
jgi:release factor glutamine methyltransferase